MELDTARLIIRSFTPGDVADYAEVAADPEVMRYLGGQPRSYAEARAYVLDCVERDRSDGVSRYAVVHRKQGLFLGYCGFKALIGDDSGNVQPEVPWVDFGWQYRRSAWRQGYGFEAAEAVHRYGKEVLGLTGIEVRTHEDNVASLRIIRRLGFVWTNDYDSTAGRFRRFREAL